MSNKTDKANEVNPVNFFGVKPLKMFDYKDFYILVQQVGGIFQYLIFKDGEWRTSFVTDEDKSKDALCKKCGQPSNKLSYTNFEIVRIIEYVSDMAKATVDLILDPEGLEKKHQDADVIVKALEENERLAQEEEKKAKITKRKKVKANARK